MELEVIECPNCKNKDLFEDFFNWAADMHGHPTFEQMTCKKCLCSNFTIEFGENYEEENVTAELEDFKEVELSTLPKSEQERLIKRKKELDTPLVKVSSSDDLPF